VGVKTSGLEANPRELGSPISFLGALQFVSDFRRRALEAECTQYIAINALRICDVTVLDEGVIHVRGRNRLNPLKFSQTALGGSWLDDMWHRSRRSVLSGSKMP
jgi:hypothetical protein